MCRAPFRSADEVNAVVIARSDLVARGVIDLGGNRISGPVLLVNNTGTATPISPAPARDRGQT
jgi:hypothetical protein